MATGRGLSFQEWLAVKDEERRFAPQAPVPQTVAGKPAITLPIRRALTHEDWLAAKQRAKAPASAGEVEKEERAAVRREEAAAAFNEWLAIKGVRERAIQLLEEVDPAVCYSYEGWYKVAVAIRASELQLECSGRPDGYRRFLSHGGAVEEGAGLLDAVGGGGDGAGLLAAVGGGEDGAGLLADVGAGAADGKPTAAGKAAKGDVKSLAKPFLAWSKKNRAGFEDVEVPLSVISGMSKSAQHDLKDEDTGNYIIPSLTFTLPAARAGGKPLTVDDHAKNRLYVSSFKKAFRKARNDALDKVSAAVDSARQRHEEREKDSLSDPKPWTDVEATAAVKASILRLGLGYFTSSIENQRRTAKQEESADASRKAEDAKHRHTAWANRKAKLRVRMPPPKPSRPGGHWQPPRFNFSTSKVPVVRSSKTKFNSTTVDMARRSGWDVKYIHSINPRGALEKDRKRLLDKGYVYKENCFDPDDPGDEDIAESKFREEVQVNKKRAEKLSRGLRRDKAEEVFENWKASKELVDVALKCIAALPLSSVLPKGSDAPLKPTADEEDLWLSVGRALKRVDRSLLNAWQSWTNGRFSNAKCVVMWDSFAPIACDTHAPASAVRQVFLKLLHKRGIDFKAAFEKFAKKIGKEEEGLTKAQFERMMVDAGIVMNDADSTRVVNMIFMADRNQDKRITRDELMAFLGSKRRMLGDASDQLNERCVWERACHECGMLYAYSEAGVCKPVDEPVDMLSAIGEGTESKAGAGDGACVRVSLADHDTPLRQRFHTTRADGTSPAAPPVCEMTTWTLKHRREGVATLKQLSSNARAAIAEARKHDAGRPPLAPTLRRTAPGEVSESKTAPGTSLSLSWEPAPTGPSVAFFVLETCGVEGKAGHRQGKYSVMVTDPPSAEAGGVPAGQHTLKGLEPSTTYLFRLQAFNAYGASPHAFCAFTTAPGTDVVCTPMVVKATPMTLTLSWDPMLELEKRIAQLRKVFDDIDVDRSDSVTAAELSEAVAKSHTLYSFIRRCRPSKAALRRASTYSMASVEDDAAELSVFDLLEANDDGVLSWPEFLSYFQHSGAWAESAAPARPATVTEQTYSLLQCVKDTEETGDHWEEVYVGKATKREVSGLKPGTTYAFRIQVTNRDGVFSAFGPVSYVTTPLSTPPTPTLVDVQPTFMTVKWAAAPPTKPPPPAAAENKLAFWAGAKQATCATDGGVGVNLHKSFAKYDTDNSGYIERSELSALLLDLGASVKDWSLDDALATMDTDGSGRVSFDEFADWWNKDHFTYVLKLSEGVPSVDHPPTAASAIGGTGRPRLDTAPPATSRALAMPSPRRRGLERKHGGVVVAPPKPLNFRMVYRGPLCSTPIPVEGLQPNTLYHARLRHVSSHSNSTLSRALRVYTPPLAPWAPVCVSVEPRQALLRWMPAFNGATKYVVEAHCSVLLDASARGRPLTMAASPSVALVGTSTVPAVKSRAYRPRTADKPVSGVRNSASARMLRPPAEEDRDGRTWEPVWEGRKPYAVVSKLVHNSKYLFRVRGVNADGVVGPASEPCMVVTPDVDRFASLSPANAHLRFAVVTSGDIVLGDTIMWTEEVFLDRGTKTRDMSFSMSTRDMEYGEAVAIGVRTVAGTVVQVPTNKAGDTSERPLSAVSLNRSTVSMQSGMGSVFSTTSKTKSFSVQVAWCFLTVKKHTRTVTDNRGIPMPADLPVVDAKQEKALTFATGSTIVRPTSVLSALDVARVAWVHEDRRAALATQAPRYPGTPL